MHFDPVANMQLLVSGLAIGSIYALVALGFVLIYNAVGVVNFAQGEFVMFPSYVAVSFIEVTGRLGGEEVTIERPIEFFIPTGQRDESQQWITATMRSLSLAARGGFVARNLQDMRKVSWDRGQVRLGDVERLDGHKAPRWHDSEVAALAYAIQQILYRRGFLDIEGGQVPSRVLAQRRHESAQAGVVSASSDSTDDDITVVAENSADAANPHALLPIPGRKCPTCGANAMIRKDGCDFCTACGEVGACG